MIKNRTQMERLAKIDTGLKTMNLKKLGKIFHNTVEAHLMDTPLLWPLYSGLNKNLVIFLFKKPHHINLARFLWPVSDQINKVHL